MEEGEVTSLNNILITFKIHYKRARRNEGKKNCREIFSNYELTNHRTKISNTLMNFIVLCLSAEKNYFQRASHKIAKFGINFLKTKGIHNLKGLQIFIK